MYNNHQSSRGDEVSQKGGYLKTKKETIDIIFNALEEGNFVPICGFEIASDKKYNTLPADLPDGDDQEWIKVLGERPLLISEERKIKERLFACRQFFKVIEDNIGNTEDTEDTEGNTQFSNDEDNRKVNYYRGLVEYIERYSPGVSSKAADRDDWIVSFLINLFELTYTLTILWAGGLRDNPQPFGNQKILTARTDEEIKEKSLMATQRLLNCCARQYEENRKENPDGKNMDLLHIEWIYCKLLYLFSQIFYPHELWDAGCSPCQAPGKKDKVLSCYVSGQCDELSQNQFSNVHSRLIRTLSGETNWEVNYNNIEVKESPRTIFIDLNHIQWLQRLIRHLLLHQTRRFRTREELAFMLSLNDEVKGLAGETSDPFELGSLFAIKDQFDIRLLKETLKYCEGDDEPNPPQPFSWSLARMLKQYPSSNSLGKHILLSLSLDRELERAMSYWFDSFHLLIPVNITEESRGQETGWLLGYCTSEKDQNTQKPIGRYTIDKWQMIYRDVLKNDGSVWQESKGPLIVKLFGAPLEDIPESNDLRYDKKEDEIIEIQHRIVLDESRLWKSLSDQLELPGDVNTPTGTAFRCFFGQDAIRWSERLPFYKCNKLMKGVKSGVPPLAISKFGVCGKTIFEKLKINHNNEPEDVIKKFILKAVMEQKPGLEGNNG